MNCQKCGSTIDGNSQFCVKCGYKVNDQTKEKLIIESKNSSKVILIISLVFFGIFIISLIGDIQMISENKKFVNGTMVGMYLLLLVLPIILLIFYFYCKNMKIVLTNKRVFGEVGFSKRVDLPLDAISAVGTSAFSGIDIGTSSGKIHFIGITNNIEIHQEISKLLNSRQINKKEQSTIVNNVINNSNADELKKYKELLDSGVITQDEFEAKKKQLLGI